MMGQSIPTGESLTTEFKSDHPRLSDRDLVEAAICLANTDGGDLYIGVEDDGTITGIQAIHDDPDGLAVMIGNRTQPAITVRALRLQEAGYSLMRVRVQKSSHIIATSHGTVLRRRLQVNGQPECVPFYPMEFESRQSDLGRLDYSARTVLAASEEEDFDPLEQERLRQMLETYGGDSRLRGLSNEELLGALGFVARVENRRVPTITGLLVLGREASIRRFLPTHSVAFQVREGTQMRVNDFYYTPLLRTFERVTEQFAIRTDEDELQIGLVRVPLPSYDMTAFREAFVNAVIHRDYARMGTVYVRIETDGLVISNPGGFVEGVSLSNLLVVEPKPRNAYLADAMKRIGLAERTGRGIDLIYAYSLRYGRPAPNYSRSDNTTVVLQMENATPDRPFYRMILEEEARSGKTMPLDSLIVLAQLRRERRLAVETAAQVMQKNSSDARGVLERMVEAGLVEARGVARNRVYTFSASVYRRLNTPNGYIRQVGFESIQQEQMVIQSLRLGDKITRKQTADLCKISKDQASYLLRRMRDEGKLEGHGRLGQTHYTLPRNTTSD